MALLTLCCWLFAKMMHQHVSALPGLLAQTEAGPAIADLLVKAGDSCDCPHSAQLQSIIQHNNAVRARSWSSRFDSCAGPNITSCKVVHGLMRAPADAVHAYLCSSAVYPPQYRLTSSSDCSSGSTYGRTALRWRVFVRHTFIGQPLRRTDRRRPMYRATSWCIVIRIHL